MTIIDIEIRDPLDEGLGLDESGLTISLLEEFFMRPKLYTSSSTQSIEHKIPTLSQNPNFVIIAFKKLHSTFSYALLMSTFKDATQTYPLFFPFV